MYGLEAKYDASVFAEKELTTVCFTANTINLFFEGDVSITIMGSFIYSPGQPESVIHQTIPVSNSNLMSLIGKIVCLAERLDDGSLALHFDEDQVLIIPDDSQEYESYSIRIGRSEIIV